MGRHHSRKPVSDIEAASETLIHPDIGSSTLRKKKETAPIMPVSAGFNLNPSLDDIQDKRTR